MADPSAIDMVTKRLALALDGLEAAVQRRREADRAEHSLAAQIQTLGIDRSRLAAELDAAAARSREVDATNREIARRLEVAMQSIRSVVEAHGR